MRISSPYADNDARLLSKATGHAEQDHVWMLSLTTAGADIRPRFRLKTEGSTSTLIAGSGSLTPGTWYHVAAVYDGAAMRLYVGGSEVGSLGKTGPITASAAGIFVGANPPDAYAPFHGELDDVRVYNTALDSAALQAVGADAAGQAAPAWQDLGLEGAHAVLRSAAEPGHYGLLEFSSNLLEGGWSVVSTSVWTEGTAMVTNLLPGTAGAYRWRMD
jgi:hypothetical protein